jgi:cytochrome c2
MAGIVRGTIIAAAAVAFTATAARADGNAAAGKQVFARCGICHSDTKGAPNKIAASMLQCTLDVLAAGFRPVAPAGDASLTGAGSRA